MRALNLTLLTYLYELTMMQDISKNPQTRLWCSTPFTERIPAAADMPFFAGLEQIIEYIQDLHFSPDDIDYLKGLNIFDSDFWNI